MVTWVDALSRARKNISTSISRVFDRAETLDEETFEELEEALLSVDISVDLVQTLIQKLDESYSGLKVSKREMLRNILLQSFRQPEVFTWSISKKPLTILIVGINGAGKTTTCAKLAHLAIQAALKPLLAATDTFRAAGAYQLKLWSDQIGCDIVAGTMGADAAAVAYDALNATISRNLDALIVDTAGRIHTKEPLMKELDKIQRSLKKRIEHAPNEIWITLDASIGKNAITQAKAFHQIVPLTGVIITKLDGTSKAGFICSIAKELNIPIRFVGLGESLDDLVPFEPDTFVDALLERSP
ncbi:MAG: signal recognition particle-docking protein FtsY [Kiritimatiellae bacterium]|nr:signal recognition particle-docking protein FtsY [Kiritimatiellia bacterium]